MSPDTGDGGFVVERMKLAFHGILSWLSHLMYGGLLDESSHKVTVGLLVICLSFCVLLLDMTGRFNRVMFGVIVGGLIFVVLKEAGLWAFPYR